MVIDIRHLLIAKAEYDLFLAFIDGKIYNEARAHDRATRIRTGIGFR
jgi:hypothetical protein